MARKVLLEGTSYSLTPSTNTITIPKYISQERMILITNVTSNKVIYNFSDPSLGVVTSGGYTSVINDDGSELTTLVLKYNTASMGATDELQVIIDEDAQTFTPAETLMDPTNKLRTTQPQALIDTDFEYGIQQSKWESIGMIDNRPYSYPSSTVIPNISSLTIPTSSKIVTVTTTLAHNLVVGTPVTVIDTYFGPANGNFIIETVPTTTTFTYKAKTLNTSTTTSIFDTNKTAIYQGNIFTNASIGVTPQTIAYNSTTGLVTITTSVAHGLSLGNEISVVGTGGLTVSGTFSTGGGSGGNTATFTSVTNLYAGLVLVSGTGQAAGATITNITGNVVTFSANFTVQAAGSYTFTIPTNGSFVCEYVPNPFTLGYYTGVGATGTITTATATTTASSPSVVTLAAGAGNAGTKSVTVTSTANLVAGMQVFVSAGTGSFATGTTVVSVTSATAFTVNNNIAVTLSGATILAANATNTVTLASATGVVVGTQIAGTAIPAGTIITALSSTSATLSAPINNPISAQSVTITASVYARPQGQFAHRPFDGGVLFGTNASSNHHTATRQTRRYFRYQSGKAIQMSSGTVLKPYTNVDLITAGALTQGSTITIQTKEKHNIQPGVAIAISGSTDSGYNNSNYVVTAVTAWNQFQVTAQAALSNLTAPGPVVVSVISWSGAINRLGIFDQQNGLFFEYNGATLYAVRRNSVYQIAGKITATYNSNTIVQTDPAYPTAFSKQLIVGDYIVIRGVSYRVTDILSDTSINISPSYRGATTSFATVSRTIDTKIPQSQWNLDRMDGTGPSGYNLKLNKMQMFYVDYTWYGAGFVRWGLRGPRGNVIYVHKMPNNNVNPEAYMRSGNLPARYESSTTPPTTYATAAIGSSDATITVADTSVFPTSGTLVIRGNTTTTATITAIASTGGGTTVTYNTTTPPAVGTVVNITGATISTYNGTYLVTSIVAGTSFTVNSSATGTTSTATATVQAYEYVNYLNTTTAGVLGASATQFTGVTRGQAGALTPATLTIAANTTNIGTVASTTGIQIGMRVIGTVNPSPVPENTYVIAISGNSITLNQAVTAANPTVIFSPMGNTAQAFSYSTTSPVAIEYAYPTFAPSLSHWGTSVIMDGRYDDDKSLLFTYGQTSQTVLSAAKQDGTSTSIVVNTGGSAQSVVGTAVVMSDISQIVPGMTMTGTNVPSGATVASVNGATKTITMSAASTVVIGANVPITFDSPGSFVTKALFSIRIAPSVDNGIPANFGARELVNRMQLILRSLDITTAGPVSNVTPTNLLVTAVLNGVPTSTTNWTNVVRNVTGVANSSLAMIADYSSGSTSINGGETTGGFYTSGTTSIDLSNVRDLGNSVIGGGGTTSNTNIYPDGPDTLTIVVTNLSAVPVAVSARLSWTEAQA